MEYVNRVCQDASTMFMEMLSIREYHSVRVLPTIKVNMLIIGINAITNNSITSKAIPTTVNNHTATRISAKFISTTNCVSILVFL